MWTGSCTNEKEPSLKLHCHEFRGLPWVTDLSVKAVLNPKQTVSETKFATGNESTFIAFVIVVLHKFVSVTVRLTLNLRHSQKYEIQGYYLLKR